MARLTLVRRLPYRAAQLFAIVADVPEYPNFLPLCTGARVGDVRMDEAGRRLFRAALDVAYPRLRLAETFVSDVVADPAALSIRTTAVGGPVRLLNTIWQFREIDSGGCDVDFYIEYHMSSRTLQFAMSTMFDYAMRKLLNAFEERARQICTPLSLHHRVGQPA